MEGPFILAQILTVGFFLIFCILTPILTIIALINLRKRELSATAKGVWALVVMVPILGPLAFWIVNPKESLYV
jgi:uncharacterized membrane protein YhaH (DUF805 family)